MSPSQRQRIDNKRRQAKRRHQLDRILAVRLDLLPEGDGLQAARRQEALPDRLRPRTLEEIVGQDHLSGPARRCGG